MRLHLISNGVFSTSIAGGDIHFLKLAEAAARAGYQLNCFGGHALREVLAQHKIPGTVTLTDQARMGKVDGAKLGGQFSLFRDFYGRYRRTLRLLPVIRSAPRTSPMRSATIGLMCCRWSGAPRAAS